MKTVKIISSFGTNISLEVRLLSPKTILKLFLNNSDATFKNLRNRVFIVKKWSKLLYQSQDITENLVGRGSISIFRAKTTTENTLLRSNIMPKQLSNNSKKSFKKVINRSFLTLKIYQPFGLKLNPKVGV